VSRAEHRRLRAIVERVDNETDSEGDFFRHFPHRRYRIRRIDRTRCRVRAHEIAGAANWTRRVRGPSNKSFPGAGTARRPPCMSRREESKRVEIAEIALLGSCAPIRLAVQAD
jgi:hypothetical protein